jgi:protein-disulfide isomerase
MSNTRRALLSVVLAGAAHAAFAAAPDPRETDRTIGSPTATHEVVECFSLTCPHCAAFALESFPAIKAKWIDTGRLRWVYYDLPTDGAALLAAMVARYLPQDRYESFINGLFASQSAWAYGNASVAEALWSRASDSGMDQATFNRAIADTHLRDWIVSRTVDAQSRWHVDATPSFVIDGKLYEGAMSADAFSQLLGS